MAIEQNDLVQKAFQLRKKAHAGYSNSAIEADDGEIYVGCNVENAAYPLGACAEVGAISSMVMGGGKKIRQIAIVGGLKDATSFDVCTPCGGCRQRIAEFATSKTQILLCDKENNIQQYSLGELLPGAFTL